MLCIILSWSGLDDLCRLRRPHATKLAHETLPQFVAAGESLIGDQVLRDAHGITASVERVLNDLAIRFRRTRVPTRFEQKYVLRGVHLELGGVKSDEATHEGGLVGETQSIVAAPPQGDLASAGFEKAGIANQKGARDVGTGDRQGSVRNKRSF